MAGIDPSCLIGLVLALLFIGAFAYWLRSGQDAASTESTGTAERSEA